MRKKVLKLSPNLAVGLLVVSMMLLGCSLGAGGKNIELKWWWPTPGETLKELRDNIVKTYESENPEIKIVVMDTPFTEHFKKLGLALSAGRGPDMYRVTEIWKYVEDGYALPMSDTMAGKERKSLYPQWVADASYKGKMYAVFDEGGPRMLVYNKKMFKEAGLESPPKSWEELAQYGQKLTKYRGDIIARAGLNLTQGASPAYSCAFAPFLLANGGQWTDETYTKLRFNETPGVEALQFWVDIIHKYKCSSLEFTQDSFLMRQSVMRIDGPWLIATAKVQAPDLVDEIEYAIIPPPTKEDLPVLQDAPWKNMVNSNTEYPDETWRFLGFFSHEWAKTAPFLYPCPIYYKDIAERSIQKAKAQGRNRLVAIFKTGAVSRRRPKWWRTIAVRTGAWIEKALLGQVSAEKALNEAAKEVINAIKLGGEV